MTAQSKLSNILFAAALGASSAYAIGTTEPQNSAGSSANATNSYNYPVTTPTNTVSQNTNHRAAAPKIIDYSPAKCWSETLGVYGFKQVCTSSRVVQVEEMEFAPAPLTTAPLKKESASGAISVNQAYIAASGRGNIKLQKNLYIEKIKCEKSASEFTTACSSERIKIGDMPLQP